jgi:geranylgeranyl diphosphate synthase, type II
VTASAQQDIQTTLKDFGEVFNQRLSQHVTAPGSAPARLEEAMRYSLLAPGKRLRPFLVYRCCTLTGGDWTAAFPPAAAIEMVHVFSLVHDDLPAMDDDDLRRGLPTSHKKFGEALAILAGDALLALAFATLATQVPDPRRASALVAELARGTGWTGMIGGQTADVLGEQEPPRMELVRYIHERKTAALFESACRMGAIAGGAEVRLVHRLGGFGRQLGLAFQIADDLLDRTSTAAVLGKNVGKDADRNKQTYPACVGTERSRALADQTIQAAIGALEGFGEEADDLRELARFAVSRSA